MLRRSLLGLAAPAPGGRRAAARSARPPADRRDGLALTRDGRREPRRPGAGGARALSSASAARRGRPAAPSRLRPFRLPRAQPLVLRRRARQAFDAGHRLVERGRTENHGDRVGLALDVQLAEQAGDPRCDASSERRTISVRRVASPPRCGELGSSGPRAAPARLALGRGMPRRRRAAGAPPTPTCGAPACPARAGAVSAAPTDGVDPVTRSPLENGRAEQRPPSSWRSHKAETVAKNAPVNGGKYAYLQGFCPVLGCTRHPPLLPSLTSEGYRRTAAVPFDDRTSSMNSSRTRQAPAIILASWRCSALWLC